MRIAVVSMFRDAPQGQIDRWVRQVADLAAAAPGHRIHAVAAEGDSVDNTYARLCHSLEVVTDQDQFEWSCASRNFHHPRYGSTEQPERMAALSNVLNWALDKSVEETSPDVVIYVESDLIWSGATLAVLADRVLSSGLDVVAPMIWAGEAFYDVWGFRGLDGSRFGPHKPYHATLRQSGAWTEVSSVGSCLAMRKAVARTVRVRDANALVGWCGEARRLGFRIWVDPRLSVRHPA